MTDFTLIATIVGLLAAIIGIITGIHYLVQMLRRREFRKLSWRMVNRGVVTIIANLRRDNFIPDLVIGIGRSGAIFGGLIAGNMGNIPLAVVDRKLHWDEKRRDIILSDFSELRVKPQHQKLLFVIGEIYSAQSISEVVKHFQPALEGRQWRTASLVKLDVAPVNVDYTIYTVAKRVEPPWVLSPDYKRH
ncbi:MAG: hypothetical protein ACRDFT_02120 [bacterium]